MEMALIRKSEYFSTLSNDSQKRYESKVATAGLTTDPYADLQLGQQ